MDSHKNHKALVQIAKRIEWTSGHYECCSLPSPHLFPSCDLCERHAFADHKTDVPTSYFEAYLAIKIQKKNRPKKVGYFY